MTTTFDLKDIQKNIPSKVKKFDPSYVTRYVIIAELVRQLAERENRQLKILDVGGYNGAARDLLPEHNITILDVADDKKLENYVKASGSKMPFEDDAFDIVISCDTLEHIKAQERDSFISEALRVSNNYFFIGAPFGTQEVVEAELNCDTFYKGITNGGSYIWLKEHAEYVLPKKAWIEATFVKHKAGFVTFDHTSINIWGLMLRANFFLADNIKTVNPSIGKRLADANNKYLKHYTFHDFPKLGYRSFYVVSKRDKVNVELPNYDSHANQDFINDLFFLLGSCMQEYTKGFGALKDDVSNLLEHNHKLDAQFRNAQSEINSIKKSRSYKLATKLASGKHKLSLISPTKRSK